MVWVRVNGRGSFQNAAGLKQFAREMMLRGLHDFTIDLENCSLMDSTFMGTLTGIALRLREAKRGSIRLIRANERNTELLHNLGLDRILSLEEASAAAPEAPTRLHTPAPAVHREEQRSTMIEAHEALVAADPSNLVRFKDVLDYLKQDLQPADEA